LPRSKFNSLALPFWRDAILHVLIEDCGHLGLASDMQKHIPPTPTSRTRNAPAVAGAKHNRFLLNRDQLWVFSLSLFLHSDSNFAY
jgi:hypothetical protein